MSPVLVTGLERLLDQQAAEARAIDEEIALDRPAVRQLDATRTKPSSLRSCDVDDLAFDPVHAGTLGEIAKEARIKTRIEMKRVKQPGQRILRASCLVARTCPAPRRSRSSTMRKCPGRTALPFAQIELVKLDALQVLAERSERMEIALVQSFPSSRIRCPA